MLGTSKQPSHADTLSLGASLGGPVSHYRGKQNIYSQGTPANTLFYIQEGGVRLTNGSKNRRPAVTASLGEGDFFGAQCLVGFPLRLSTAVTLTGSLIRSIQKQEMIRMLHTNIEISTSLVSYLLSDVKKYQDHVAELLTFHAEQRLARELAIAHLDREGSPLAEVPNPSQQVPVEMVGNHCPASISS
jgi:CRP-like cAMP-binding protein